MPVTDHTGREVDHPLRDAAMGQEIAGEDEERDRHDLELLDTGEEFQRYRFQRHLRKAKEKGKNCEAQRN